MYGSDENSDVITPRQPDSNIFGFDENYLPRPVVSLDKGNKREIIFCKLSMVVALDETIISRKIVWFLWFSRKIERTAFC